MSLSLRIQHGDLALEGNSLAPITGPQKMVQDLRCALLTPIGSVEPHPEFGSTLSDENSTDTIGNTNNSEAAVAVLAEINRICAAYQRQQVARNNADASTYGRLTIAPGETLLRVKNVDIIPIEDKMVVAVEIQTGEETQQVIIPLIE